VGVEVALGVGRNDDGAKCDADLAELVSPLAGARVKKDHEHPRARQDAAK